MASYHKIYSIAIHVIFLGAETGEGGSCTSIIAPMTRDDCQLTACPGFRYVYTLHVLIKQLPQMEYSMFVVDPTVDGVCGGE